MHSFTVVVVFNLGITQEFISSKFPYTIWLLPAPTKITFYWKYLSQLPGINSTRYWASQLQTTTYAAHCWAHQRCMLSEYLQGLLLMDNFFNTKYGTLHLEEILVTIFMFFLKSYILSIDRDSFQKVFSRLLTAENCCSNIIAASSHCHSVLRQ